MTLVTDHANEEQHNNAKDNTFIQDLGDEKDEFERVLETLLRRDLNDHKMTRRQRRAALFQNQASRPPAILQKRLLTVRFCLLAVSLMLTLLVFWLLDSLKDPTFATLVDGNLDKHQPLAKMASVLGTVTLVVLMEVISHGRHAGGDNSVENAILNDEEVRNGGGYWTKMDVSTTVEEEKYKALNDENQIPVSMFQTVGLSYIFAFGLISVFLRYHHGFAGSNAVGGSVVWYILGYIQYITIESFGSFGVATFWSFVNSTLTLNAAKSSYGFFIAVAQLGAIAGSTIATLPGVSIPSLFLVACGGILAQITIMQIYVKRFPESMNEENDLEVLTDEKNHDCEMELKSLHMKRSVKEIDTHNFTPSKDMSSSSYVSGVSLILKNNYLLLILGVSCLYEISLTCLDYEMKLIGLDRFRSLPDLLEDKSVLATDMSEEAATSFAVFMGRYGQLTNFLSLLLSYFAFPYLMENYGLKYTLRIFPTMLLIITVMTFIALPMNLPVLFVSISLLKALTYSINDPAKEILYIPTSNTVKFKAKFWIDVVGARVAKAIGSSINTYAGTIDRIVKYGSFPSLLTAAALWFICYTVGIRFDELLETGEIIGASADEIVLNRMLFESMDCFNSDKEDQVNDIEHEMDTQSEKGWESNVSIELIIRNKTS
jgi:AAA family ATP:ADP antiporter